MKKLMKCVLPVVILMTCVAAQGQTNVKKAFEALLDSPDVKYTETHSMSKDPNTGQKESQIDTYDFKLPASKVALVNNIVKAFKADEKEAYTYSSGDKGKHSITINLAVGDGKSEGYAINPDDQSYVYACYLAPKDEDPTGNYRYAYGMKWKEEKGEIEGSLVVTYATTLNYRQTEGAIIIHSPKQDWFSNFTSLVIGLQRTSGLSRQSVSSKIFKAAQESQTSKDVTAEEKEAAREVLKSLLSDTKKYDEITMRLLNQALVSIK